MDFSISAGHETAPQPEPDNRIVQELMDGRPVAGIYIRTSTTFQGEHGTSLETQAEQCTTLVEGMGYRVDPNCIWKDMESGAFMSRDGLEKMLEAVKTRRVEMVVIHNPDRLGREPVDLLIIARVFHAAGVRLEFVNGPSDRDPEAELLMFILGYVGQKERIQIMERTMRGKEKLARDGRYPIGPKILGYDYDRDNKVRTINEEEAAIVRRIFQWTLEGVSRYRIAIRLNDEGIRTKKGKKWRQGGVKRIVENVAYTGRHYYGRYRHRKVDPKVAGKKREVTEKPLSEAFLIENFTPRIISPELFEAAQERVRERAPRFRRKGTRYLLTGFVRCGLCGGSVVGSSIMRGKRHYRCSDAKKTETTPASCKAGYIRADELEQIVWNLVVEAIRSPEVLASEIRKHVTMGTGNLEEERTKLRREIQDLKAQQARLLEQRQKDFIDQEILESRIVPVKILCDEKERSLTVLDEQRRKKDDAEAAEARIVEFCERVSEGLEDTSPDRKRATLAAFQTKVQATRADLQVTVTVDPCVAISTRPSTFRVSTRSICVTSLQPQPTTPRGAAGQVEGADPLWWLRLLHKEMHTTSTTSGAGMR